MRLFLRKVEEKASQLKEQFEMEEIDTRNTNTMLFTVPPFIPEISDAYFCLAFLVQAFARGRSDRSRRRPFISQTAPTRINFVSNMR